MHSLIHPNCAEALGPLLPFSNTAASLSNCLLIQLNLLKVKLPLPDLGTTQQSNTEKVMTLMQIHCHLIRIETDEMRQRIISPLSV